MTEGTAVQCSQPGVQPVTLEFVYGETASRNKTTPLQSRKSKTAVAHRKLTLHVQLVKTRSRGVEVIDLSRPTFNQKPFRTELTAHLVIEVYEVRRLDAILTNMRGNKTRTLN